MEAAIKEAGSLIGSLGRYARLIIVGVWFPGFLIVCELGSIYLVFFGPSGQDIFAYIAKQINHFDSNIVSAFIVVLVLAASIATGYVSRDIAFAISDLWLYRQWKPTRTPPEILAQICRVHGERKVNEIMARYNVFRLATGEVDGLSLPRMPESYIREFCKQWLSVFVPTLNTDGLEIEINMVIGLVVPVALSSCIWLAFFAPALGIPLAIVSIVAAAFMLYRIAWARNIETEQAIVNFLFAHWENLPERMGKARGKVPAEGDST